MFAKLKIAIERYIQKVYVGCTISDTEDINLLKKGGVAEYPKHYLMKKNRLIILLKNLRCEICGKPAVEVHHRDGSKFNHELSNLMASCHRCNSKIRFKPNNSKYRRLYGMSLREIIIKKKIDILT